MYAYIRKREIYLQKACKDTKKFAYVQKKLYFCAKFQ